MYKSTPQKSAVLCIVSILKYNTVVHSIGKHCIETRQLTVYATYMTHPADNDSKIEREGGGELRHSINDSTLNQYTSIITSVTICSYMQGPIEYRSRIKNWRNNCG